MRFFSRSHKIQVGTATLSVHLDNRFGKEGDYTAEARMGSEHFHTQYELFFVPGRLAISVEGEERLLTSGVLCLPPFTHHAVRLRENVFTLRITVKEGEAAPPPLLQTVGVLLLSDFAASLLPRLALANHKASKAAESEIDSLLFLLFLDLYEENVARPGMIKTEQIDDYCAIIDHYVHIRYGEPVTLKTLADALHLSTKQTSRIISSRYHTTLNALLKEKRLAVAAELLRSGELSVGEIARRVFGHSESYFFHLFREKYGISPLAFRKAARKETDA